MKYNYFKHLFMCLCFIASFNTFAYDAEIDGIYYIFTSDSTATVTYQSYINYSYVSDYSGSIVIPESVTYNGKTYSVTSISNAAFSGCTELTFVTIPNSVTSIGYGNLDLPNRGTFYGCTSLSSITIPESVTSIGPSAFSGCSNLTSISIPESVTSIGANAFSGTPWYDNLPDGVVYIGKVAYKYKGTMPEGVQIVIAIKEGTTMIADYAFEDCSSITSVTIPNSVTSIGYRAFSGCTGLTSITIGNGVTSIGDSAFRGCTGLTSITIPKGVTRINDSAFRYCI